MSLENMGFISLIIQLLIILFVFYSVNLASRGKSAEHCKVISIALIVQVIAILFFMSPVMSSFIELDIGSASLVTQMWLHHLAGIVIFILAVYIKLAMKNKVKFLGNPYTVMKVTLALWILVFIGGLSLYLSLRHGISLL